MSDRPETVLRVVSAASAAGVDLEVVEHAEGTRTAFDAAAAVGCEVGQIVKSLVFELDGELAVALTSGANIVDTAALAAIAGAARCDRATADQVREATGYAIGGVPPFGHARALRVYFDVDLADYEIVWAAAGTPRHVFRIEPSTLRRISDAVPGRFGRPHSS